MRYINRRVFTHSSASGVRAQNCYIFTLKNPIFGYIMESLWQIHIRITTRCIELRCWNLANCLTLPSAWSKHESFSVRGAQGASSHHIKFWDPLHISETNRARKLKFGTLVGSGTIGSTYFFPLGAFGVLAAPTLKNVNCHIFEINQARNWYDYRCL